MSNVTISKGGTTVTIHSVEATEDFGNKLSFIRPPQQKQKQGDGPKDTKVIDMLIITHSLVVRGHITKTDSQTAKQVLDDLKTLFKGGSTAGSPAVITYDGDTLNMFPEKLMVIKKPLGEPTSPENDVIQYDIQVTLIEGESV